MVIRPSASQRADIEGIAESFLDGREFGPLVEETLDEVLEDATRGGAPSYRRDIRPWLGRRAAGFMTSFDPENGAVVIETDDDDAAGDFAGEVATEDGTVARVVGGYLVVGTEAGVRAAEDALDGDSLSESESFTDAVEEADAGEALAYGYAQPRPILRQAKAESSVGVFLRDLGLLLDRPYVATLRVRAGVATLDQRFGLERRSEGGDLRDRLAALPGQSWLRLASAQAGHWMGPAFVALARLGAARAGEEEMLPEALAQLDQVGLDFNSLGLGDAELFVRGSRPANFQAGFVADVEDRQAAEISGRFLVSSILDDYRARRLPRLPGGPEGALVEVTTLPEPLVVAVNDERFVVALGVDSARALLRSSQTDAPVPELEEAEEALGSGVSLSGTLDVSRLLGLIEAFQSVPGNLPLARDVLEPLGPVALGTRRDGRTLLVRLAARAD